MVTSVARHGALGQTLQAPAGLGLRPLGPGQGPFWPCCPGRCRAPGCISALMAVGPSPGAPLPPRSAARWYRQRVAAALLCSAPLRLTVLGGQAAPRS